MADLLIWYFVFVKLGVEEDPNLQGDSAGGGGSVLGGGGGVLGGGGGGVLGLHQPP